MSFTETILLSIPGVPTNNVPDANTPDIMIGKVDGFKFYASNEAVIHAFIDVCGSCTPSCLLSSPICQESYRR